MASVCALQMGGPPKHMHEKSMKSKTVLPLMVAINGGRDKFSRSSWELMLKLHLHFNYLFFHFLCLKVENFPSRLLIFDKHLDDPARVC